ncbi:uncharacterized protein BDZ99DRAFT_520580 [Mytilinidion resinicola]|uniref:Uncharacterized protein n=1 Tax=Mytilinidion resinicola TaxID=574789 RepID=A0A6A6YR59_9PEZI|nr:uncharacterized protein BDZ99DRAFT_520580 [Mytilinidion resinicola]KAF2810514.1 hypothetical protein BDZ99DRAFT_520580 [Mytilinidion resinicola]
MEHAWHSNAQNYTNSTRRDLLTRLTTNLPGFALTLEERRILIRSPLLDIYAGPHLLFRAQPKLILYYCPSLTRYLTPPSSPSSPESLCLPPHSTDRPSLRLVLEHLRAKALSIVEDAPPLLPPAGLVPAIRLVETAKLFGLPEARALDTRIFRRLRYAQLSAADVAAIWDTLRDTIWVPRMAAWLRAHRARGDVRDWVGINRVMVEKRELAGYMVRFGREGRRDLEDPGLWSVEEREARGEREREKERLGVLRERKREAEAVERRMEERKANPQLIRRLSERRRSIMQIVERVHAEQAVLRKSIVGRRWRALIVVVRVVVILARGLGFRWADEEFY